MNVPSIRASEGASVPEPTGLFLQALLAGDQTQACSIASDARRHGWGHLYERVIAPAMRQVGNLWQEGRISIADEHLATAICEATIASFYREFAWPVGGPPALVACVSPERHQLGARMVADMLSLDGWHVDYLGADVPMDVMVEMAVSRAPAMVGLSAALEDHLPALAATVAELCRALPGVQVLVGGQAVCALACPASLGAHAHAYSCCDAVRAAAEWKR